MAPLLDSTYDTSCQILGKNLLKSRSVLKSKIKICNCTTYIYNFSCTFSLGCLRVEGGETLRLIDGKLPSHVNIIAQRRSLMGKFPVSLFVLLGIALRVKVRFTILNTVESKSKKESSLKSLFNCLKGFWGQIPSFGPLFQLPHLAFNGFQT